MNNPGGYSLGDVALAAINAATTAMVVTSGSDESGTVVAYVGGLEGMLAAKLEANFNYGSGGTSIKVMFETSDNQGVTWQEVGRLAFATASAEKWLNLSALTDKTSAVTPGAQSDDSGVAGSLGVWFRTRILTVGTYAGNTSLSIRLTAR